MQGPSPFEAGSSRSADNTSRSNIPQHISTPPATAVFQEALPTAVNNIAAPNPTQYAYYNYTPQTWGQIPQWQAYSPQITQPYYSQYQTYHPQAALPQTTPSQPQPDVAPQAEIRSSSPPPPPLFRKDWDVMIKRFLQSAGLTQALRGFDSDMLVMNPDWEREKIPAALSALLEDLTSLQGSEDPRKTSIPETPLDERKLEHVHFRKDVEARTPSKITRDISRFLAQNRARNDASNRNEFLLSLVEKKRKLQESNLDTEVLDPCPSCARTDAKTQNRDVQMKYDIVKNEDGPLRKTMKREQENHPSEPETDAREAKADDIPTAQRYPALDERLRNIETHVAVRYVPSPPRSLLDRLKFLEEHLVLLEKDYPPWAALHFNQPHRGWPPPPRPTPIIVPSHLTATTEPSNPPPATSNAPTPEGSELGPSKSKGKSAGRSTMSSLQRAVLERLEVQKARNDLEGIVKKEPSS